MYAIEVENVSKSFSEGREFVQALKGVNLKIKEGEIFSLLGPNGAGKSTLLNKMVDMLTLYSGEIRIFGRDVSQDRGNWSR